MYVLASQQSMSFEMIWLTSFIIMGPLVFLAMRRWRKNAKQVKRANDELNSKKEYYHILTKEKMDNCPREDLATAAIVHVLRKESEDYDNVYNNLNESEKIVYIIYESMLSIDNGKGSIRTFFESDFYKPFFPMIDKAFNAIDCREIGDMMKAARHFQYIIENNIDDDVDLGDYAHYNYGDFTNEFMTLIMTLNVNNRLIDFIDEHRDDFIDEEVEEDENISE